MAQKSYEATVEAVVQRTVYVVADSIDEAEQLACQEVTRQVGALSTEVFQIRKIENVD
jgi:hypothetical protein